VAHHLPYVGHFLYDNPRNGITILPSVQLEHSFIQVVGITNSVAYKNVVGARRASWKVLLSIEQQEDAKGSDVNVNRNQQRYTC
jgi:hypothetical protein